jgi:DNA polymerase (family 10)
MRLDLNDLHCAQARAAGVPIVINTDAHSVDGLDVMRYGILQARRGALTRADEYETVVGVVPAVNEGGGKRRR